jgi:hypothetical protein
MPMHRCRRNGCLPPLFLIDKIDYCGAGICPKRRRDTKKPAGTGK